MGARYFSLNIFRIVLMCGSDNFDTRQKKLIWHVFDA